MIILRFIVWGAIVVTIVMGALWMGWITPGPQRRNGPERSNLTVATVEVGGPFALTNHGGEPFRNENH